MFDVIQFTDCGNVDLACLLSEKSDCILSNPMEREYCLETIQINEGREGGMVESWMHFHFCP